MIQSFLNFLKSKQITPEKGKLIVNKKFVFILNDQLTKYVQKSPKVPFAEFVFSNAQSKNQTDFSKVQDFFSRILNTVSDLHNSIFEFKTFLFLLNSQDSTGKDAKYYFLIRKTMLDFKGEQSAPKVMTSLIQLRQVEINNILQFFKIKLSEFHSFLKHEMNIEPQIVGIDSIIYFFLKEKPQLVSKFSKENAIEMRKFVVRNKLRRAMVKLRFVTTLNRVVQINRNSKDIKVYDIKKQELKKEIRNKMYYKKMVLDNFIESYLSTKVKDGFQKTETLIKGISEEILKQKKTFCGFLEKIIGQKQGLAEQIVLLYYLKQKSELTKI